MVVENMTVAGMQAVYDSGIAFLFFVV